ncbi:hypothetical protein GH714_017148 [Hevea brasiliensis]|uniref:Amino acid transporter transmembrane domain-containing protein n=1 Tax=Hevea brasiliensis TaxID=3981 RepID=A0A6A6M340_HEVBR|nr:hypothetical protein GH714_017148 [Hevea brasiliensis]
MLPQKQAEEAIVSNVSEMEHEGKEEEKKNIPCLASRAFSGMVVLPGMLGSVVLPIKYMHKIPIFLFLFAAERGTNSLICAAGSWTAYLISVLYIEYRSRKEKENVNFKNHVIQGNHARYVEASKVQVHIFISYSIRFYINNSICYRRLLGFRDELLNHSNAFSLLPKSGFRDAAVILMLIHQFITFGFACTPLYFVWRSRCSSGQLHRLHHPVLAHMLTYRKASARQNAAEKPPFFLRSWAAMYILNTFVAVWVLVVGFGFGGWASMANFVKQVDTFGLFAKCYQCKPPLPPPTSNSTTTAATHHR